MRRPARLSAEFVKRIDAPGRYGDGRGSFGLSLLVQPSGDGISKAWTQRFKGRNGRYTSIGLGGYPVVTLAAARGAAASNALQAKAGADVLAGRRGHAAPLGALTFEQAAERAIETQRQGWKNADTVARDKRRGLALYVYPAIGRMPIAAVDYPDVYAVLEPLFASKHATGVKVRTTLNTVFAWALAHGLVTSNPTPAITPALAKPSKRVQHHRALPWQDVAGALATIEGSNATPAVKLAVKFLALTAARSGEGRGARWSEIDVDARTWTIPGERMKESREHRVPLSDAAMAVLDNARALDNGSGLVFPSPRSGQALSQTGLSKLLQELGIDGTPHGFRSSFDTWAAEHDVPRDVSQFALAHVEGSASERAYQALRPVQASAPLVMAAWSDGHRLSPRAPALGSFLTRKRERWGTSLGSYLGSFPIRELP